MSAVPLTTASMVLIPATNSVVCKSMPYFSKIPCQRPISVAYWSSWPVITASLTVTRSPPDEDASEDAVLSVVCVLLFPHPASVPMTKTAAAAKLMILFFIIMFPPLSKAVLWFPRNCFLLISQSRRYFSLPDSYAFLTPKCFKNVQPKSWSRRSATNPINARVTIPANAQAVL